MSSRIDLVLFMSTYSGRAWNKDRNWD